MVDETLEMQIETEYDLVIVGAGMIISPTQAFQSSPAHSVDFSIILFHGPYLSSFP